MCDIGRLKTAELIKYRTAANKYSIYCVLVGFHVIIYNYVFPPFLSSLSD